MGFIYQRLKEEIICFCWNWLSENALFFLRRMEISAFSHREQKDCYIPSISWNFGFESSQDNAYQVAMPIEKLFKLLRKDILLSIEDEKNPQNIAGEIPIIRKELESLKKLLDDEQIKTSKLIKKIKKLDPVAWGSQETDLL